ncbi:hypothetical protein P154DRAFT_569886 [Amniculicola lignicola CBS 123094]|uniref:Uncharacterized protein n=1 Tax=Amniculicola lignicola CBS 123094 TaxID=1392246 RepID=A0A6A5WZU2_9PLEO|nr:hypothetical protein P154DRAFT_569886 [Amniculicola lignicola CBS 123094]
MYLFLTLLCLASCHLVSSYAIDPSIVEHISNSLLEVNVQHDKFPIVIADNECSDVSKQPHCTEHGDWPSISCFNYSRAVGGSSLWLVSNATVAAWKLPQRQNETFSTSAKLSFTDWIWDMFAQTTSESVGCESAKGTGCRGVGTCGNNNISPGGMAIIQSLKALDTLPNSENPDAFKAQGYTPGTCKVLVNQYIYNKFQILNLEIVDTKFRWAKDDGRENKLSEYQTEIKIYDAAGDEAGNAAKDAGSDPRVVVNSLLPYQLIVNTWGDCDADNKDSMVEFWYSDQWWLSIDQEHKCNFKPWDGKERSVTCEFSCPQPIEGQDAPTSAITSRRPAEALETAIPGTVTYANSYTTDAPAPPPNSPTPIQSYDKGLCGVHIEHYQKQDGHDYELEAYIFEAGDPADKRVIGYSGRRAFAFHDHPVPVKSCTEGEPCLEGFYVRVGAVDQDPITFNYNGKTWRSNDVKCKKKDGPIVCCAEGKYDDGHRGIDCGFEC